jgi:hypothetical protein
LQRDDDWYKEVKEFIEKNTMLVPKFEGFTMGNDGLMRYNNQIYVSANDELIIFILNEAHKSNVHGSSRSHEDEGKP